MTYRILHSLLPSTILVGLFVGVACGSSTTKSPIDTGDGSYGAGGQGNYYGGGYAGSLSQGGRAGFGGAAGHAGYAGYGGYAGHGGAAALTLKQQCAAKYPAPAKASLDAAQQCACSPGGACVSQCMPDCQQGAMINIDVTDACTTCEKGTTDAPDPCNLDAACNTQPACQSYVDCLYGKDPTIGNGAGGGPAGGNVLYPVCSSGISASPKVCADCLTTLCCNVFTDCQNDMMCPQCGGAAPPAGCQYNDAALAVKSCYDAQCGSACNPL